jgi:hypothetical protein
MEATDDPVADAAYVRVRMTSGPAHTDVREDGTIIDIDDEMGEILGFEMLSVLFRGIGAFHEVPEPGRKLVSKAIEASRLTHRFAKASDDAYVSRGAGAPSDTPRFDLVRSSARMTLSRTPQTLFLRTPEAECGVAGCGLKNRADHRPCWVRVTGRSPRPASVNVP